MINMSYRDRLHQLILDPQNIAAKRVAFLLDKFNFDDVKVIADIGSWHGKQAIELAKIFPKAKILVFEPSPENKSECVNNILNSGINQNQFIFISDALSDLKGQCTFYILDTEKTSSSNKGIGSLSKLKEGVNGSFIGDYWPQKEITVNTDTGDNILNLLNLPCFDLIWMDVQGAELKVLKGLSSTITKTKAIMTEAGEIPYYEEHSLLPDLDTYLSGKGFSQIKEAYSKVSWASDIASEADVVYINNAI